MKRAGNQTSTTEQLPSRLADLICKAMNLFCGVKKLTPQEMKPGTVKAIGKELMSRRFRVGTRPLAGDLPAFILVLTALKVLGGYSPESGDQHPDELNHQRDGVVRLLRAAGDEVAGHRFLVDWERPSNAQWDQFALLVPKAHLHPDPRRESPEKQAAQYRNAESENQDRKVDGHNRQLWQSCRMETNDERTSGTCQRAADRSADKSKRQILDCKLPQQCRLCCTHRDPNGNFASATGVSGQQQIGNVGTGDQKNQNHRSH